MTAGCERAQLGADLSDHNTAVVTPQDVDWLIAHLKVMVAASSAVWAGRGMTLIQLTALHVIGALAPVTLTDLANALGTKSPATSAMVDRLTHAGLVRRTLDPRDRRHHPRLRQVAQGTTPQASTVIARCWVANLQPAGPAQHRPSSVDPLTSYRGAQTSGGNRPTGHCGSVDRGRSVSVFV